MKIKDAGGLGHAPWSLFSAIFANAVDLEVVAGGVKTVLAADLFFQFADLRRKEFHGSAAFGADHVMVAATIELVLVAGGAVGEGNGAGQSAFGQQLERAIDGGEADLGVSLFDEAEELVGGEVIAGIEEGAQNGVALFGVLEAHAS